MKKDKGAAEPKKGGGSAEVFIIVIGLIVVLFFLGVFKAGNASLSNVNYRSILRLPCGISLKEPDRNERISFPMNVRGYMNGCGWTSVNGSLGTVQVFDSKGIAITEVVTIPQKPAEAGLPYSFKASVKLFKAPTSGDGHVLFTSSSGLIHSVGVRF